ncbi:MAG: pentapeptide repeat-containing protein [Cyanobacteria bacterium P01_G01_bin.54]
MSIWRNVWSVLTTEIEIQAVIEGSVATFTQVLELAGTLQEHKGVQSLAPLVRQLDSALVVLNAPLMQVAGATVPFLPLATGLLQAAIKATRQEPELKGEILLVAQVAYVEAVRCFLREHPEISAQLTTPAGPDLQRQIGNLGRHIELSDRHIEDVLLCFHRSEVAEQLNALFLARLQESGVEAERANLIARRVLLTVHRQLKKAVAEVQDQARQLAAIYGEGWQQDLGRDRSIDDYLATRIATLPQETVFDEAFTFAQVYVPSAVQPVIEGEVQQHQPRQNIETWARDCLLDETKAGQLLFIQGGPGRGKSVFCRLFADWVRRELHPIYTPILIRLRDGIDLKRNFDEALASAIGWDFVTNDSGWLTDLNTRYLFLLDGFDELFLEQGGKGSVQELLEQVSRFQERSARNPERGHRILITGRPLALYGIERQMPTNLDWVSIALMDKAAQADWLERWRTVTDQETSAAFRDFIWNTDCPEPLQKLAQEPLLLYLLAKMHREGAIDVNLFRADDANAVKVQVYEAAVNWVLTRQRPERMNEQLTELEQEELRTVLAEAGLCVVQSGNERALIAMIEDRLVQRGDTAAAELIKAARSSKAKTPLKNALAAFYLKAGETENSVEFFHKSFGEFLCAERLVESFTEWTEKGKRRRAAYAINDNEFEWQVYDLLGYGHLSQEILDYVMVLLKRDLTDEQWVALFERLNDFYLRWSDGEFIEAIDVERILPLEKARQMQKSGVELGQRQADVYVGANIFKVLSCINKDHQENDQEIRFNPCGNHNNERGFYGGRFSQFIHYISCEDPSVFNREIGQHLGSLDLSFSDLSHLDLWKANLKSTNLEGSICHHSNFRKANLENANLQKANFKHSNLSSTNLRLADISHSYLCKVDLSGADLTNAKIDSSDIGSSNLDDANFRNISADKKTIWIGCTNMDTIRNIPSTVEELPSFKVSHIIRQSIASARKGDLDDSISNLNLALEIDPDFDISHRLLSSFLWWGCLHGSTQKVSFAKDKLLDAMKESDSLLNNVYFRDRMAIYKAMTGDLEGASQDFKAVLSFNESIMSQKFREDRLRWMKLLQENQNPFDIQELEKLRENVSLDW